MAVKLSDLTTESAPASTDILLIADPTTGLAKKITVSALKTYMDGLGGGTDTTAPTIVSATATSGNLVTFVFSESVTVTSAGWSFTLNGGAWAISSVSGSGATWVFTMSTNAAVGNTLAYAYSSTTGNTVDTASNELVTTSGSITNSIGLTQLATPTLTATVIGNTQIDLSWTNVANESSYKLEWSANGTSGWTQIGGTIAANTTTYSHTGLTAATLYYYRISAIGDGVTYSDSGYGTDSDTTSTYDTDASTYFTAASITDNTEKTAWNTFVTTMKSNSLWTKIYAVYPYLGSTPTKASYNAKAPASFQITWTGTPTADATGVTGNGSTISGDTGWDPYTNVTPADGVFVGYYGRNALTTQQIPMGCTYNGLTGVYIWPTDGATGGYVSGGKGSLTGSNQVTTKFHIGGSYNTDNYYYRNGANVMQATHSGNTTFTTETVKVLGCSDGGAIIESDLNLGFSILTKGLSSGEVTTLTTAVDTLMTSLSRNV